MLDFAALEAARVFDEPFRCMAAEHVISQAQAAEIRRDYPAIDRSGFLPLAKHEVKGAFAALIEDLQSPRLAEILAVNLDLDLVDKPRMITVRRLSKIGDGRIHNDSVSKIATMLLYLNDSWDVAAGGAVRALNGPHDMSDFAVEITPLAGNAFAFARSETSWHGHPPFAGERYVVQTTFLISQDALARKENRGAVQMLLKKLNPFAR
jgi:hypothetical protein